MKRDLNPETIKQILELKKTGLNNSEVAKIVGCNRDSVRKYVTLYGDANGIDFRTTAEKVEDLWNKGYTINEIAKAANVSAQSVRVNVVKLGLREKREYHVGSPDAFNKTLPPLNLNNEPVYYPERNIKPKKYVDRGKKYLDVTEVFGI